MARFNLFEFEDLNEFPSILRDGMTDYLRYILTKLKVYDSIIYKINELLRTSKSNCIIDLCSGGGGAIESIHKSLLTDNPDLEIVLTDLYPNKTSFEFIQSCSAGKIKYYQHPVDATQVPVELKGVRTMFSAFHHFNPQKAKEVIKDAVVKKEPIAIFDGAEKNLLMVVGMLLFHPLFFIIFTPFIKPFKFYRILFTYVLPVIPFCTIWDGFASILRLYTSEQMLQMAQEIEKDSYEWSSGTIEGKSGIKIAFLIGHPKH